MVDNSRPQKPTRDQLLRMAGGDQRLLRSLEDLFVVVPSEFILIEDDIVILNRNIQEAASNVSTLVPTLLKLLAQPEIITITGNFTTVSSCYLNITNSCTITLNTTPSDNEQVIVSINGDIIVDVTDGVGTHRYTVNGTKMSYRYSAILDEWLIAT